MRGTVRIVRFADEGFSMREMFSPFWIYQKEVTDYRSALWVSHDDPMFVSGFNSITGCYCFFSEFSMESVKSILKTRCNNNINIGYLPDDYCVLVRNVNADGSRIVRVFKDLSDPETGIIHRFEADRIYDTYAWIRMKLSMAIKRNAEYKTLKSTKRIDEHYSEMFLTTEDFQHLKGVEVLPNSAKVLFE